MLQKHINTRYIIKFAGKVQRCVTATVRGADISTMLQKHFSAGFKATTAGTMESGVAVLIEIANVGAMKQ